MAKEESPSTSKDLQELQRKLSLLIESFQNNSKVVAFMKSPAGQYLDRHPFLALTLLVFVAMSAVPVGFFVLLVVLTSLAALVGVMLLEGSVLEIITVAVGWSSGLCDHARSEGRVFATQHSPCYPFAGKRNFSQGRQRKACWTDKSHYSPAHV
ncbi:lipid droplet assembly factor 1 isoform X2 [Cynocephalus volans]|uniref:lipid droplet assembly factor 1 isoform X2 n=1 Tax=Cynocephalus volans TaxID=110931 RepID=UPI002FCC643F